MTTNTSRSVLFTAMTLIVFLFSAVLTVPAYADDDAPPPTDPPTEGTPPADFTDPAPVAAGAAADILSQVNDDAQVVILDAEGEALPLATEEAAHVIADGDPMWCPVGVIPGSGSCTASFSDFNGGLLPAINNKTVAGVIWVENSYSSAETGIAIDLSPGSVGTTANYALTINGGWTGTGTAISGISTFTVPLLITGWTGAVTLKNLVVDDSSAPVAVGAVNNFGLIIQTAGAITLDTVKSQNNSDSGIIDVMGGALLDNTASSAGATVAIKNSSFDDNEARGLVVTSDGMVTLGNISANGNGSKGAQVLNWSASTDKAVIMTGFGQFNNNADNGLGIYSKGAITLTNLVANGNLGNGVHMENDTSAGLLGITIKGINQFNNNTFYGLTVFSRGTIALNSITAEHNGYGGASVDNASAATLPKAITLTGTNTFNANGTAALTQGLAVNSLGAITISNITASGNNTGGDDSGAILTNDFPDAVGGITILGYGTFEHNALYGLKIFSRGAITLNNVNANKNGTGALIENCGPDFTPGSYPDCAYIKPITLKGTNNFSGNTAYGLEALSGGALKANNLSANGNGSAQGYFDIFNSNAPKIGNAFLVGRAGITLTGVNTFNNDADYEGASINSSGKITISNLNANDNFGNGAYLSGGGGIAAILLSGVNTFSDNGGWGLYTDENYGSITLNNVTANGNGWKGVYIKNDYAPATPWNITLLGTNQFNDDLFTGLEIQTYGAVLLNNISANYSQFLSGLYVDNHNGTLPKPITLNGFNNFGDNYSSGMELYSLGVITLNNIAADHNGSFGSKLRNDYLLASAASPGVFIKGTNSFSNNIGDTGLDIESEGAVTLNNINASSNAAGYGVYVNNAAGLLKTVTLTGVNNINDNAYTGLLVVASGAVTLTRVTVNSNDPTNTASGAGMYVTTPGKITLTCGFAYNNGTQGIYLHSTGGGLVTVKGLYSFSNGLADDLSAPNLVIYPCALP